MFEWLVMAIASAVFVGLLSPQPTQWTRWADVRYLAPALPFCAAAVGGLLGMLYRKSRSAAYGVFALLVLCNGLTLSPFHAQFRWLLPAYVREVHSPYPTSYETAAGFLRTNAEQDDTVFALPQYANYPLMFYLGHRVRIACTLTADAAIPAEKARRLSPHLLMDETFPKWLVVFGPQEIGPYRRDFSRTHKVAGKTVRHHYTLAATLDVFWKATHRPELFRHHFRPKRVFDRRTEAVYIFRRTE